MFNAHANSTSTANGSTLGPFDHLHELDDLSLSFAYQPIVEGRDARVIGYEVLVRGVAGQPAESVLSSIRPENRERFDQAVRLRAIREASRLGIDKPLHLNCSWLSPENVSAALVGMLNMASACGMARSDLVLEMKNLAAFKTLEALADLRRRMKTFHVRLLVDQFGAGQADLARLAVLRPDMVKLDRRLVTGIDRSRTRQAIVSGILSACRALGAQVIALGVESEAEMYWLSGNGISQYQGFYFAAPAIDRLPEAVPAQKASTYQRFGEDFDLSAAAFAAA
ncbi:MAG: EAL domain-containing protein [Wenzhouxiangella sp.]